MTEIVAPTYLGEHGGWERIGVRLGSDRYLILTKPAKGMNAEVVGYRTRVVSMRVHPDQDTAIRAALAAIERLLVNPVTFRSTDMR